MRDSLLNPNWLKNHNSLPIEWIGQASPPNFVSMLYPSDFLPKICLKSRNSGSEGNHLHWVGTPIQPLTTPSTPSRSSSREVGIRLPTWFCLFYSRGTLPTKRVGKNGHQLLGDPSAPSTGPGTPTSDCQGLAPAARSSMGPSWS